MRRVTTNTLAKHSTAVAAAAAANTTGTSQVREGWGGNNAGGGGWGDDDGMSLGGKSNAGGWGAPSNDGGGWGGNNDGLSSGNGWGETSASTGGWGDSTSSSAAPIKRRSVSAATRPPEEDIQDMDAEDEDDDAYDEAYRQRAQAHHKQQQAGDEAGVDSWDGQAAANDGWGASTSSASAGEDGWGAGIPEAPSKSNVGGWGQAEQATGGGSWGGDAAAAPSQGGWGSGETNAPAGGWGEAPATGSGGWGDSAPEAASSWGGATGGGGAIDPAILEAERAAARGGGDPLLQQDAEEAAAAAAQHEQEMGEDATAAVLSAEVDPEYQTMDIQELVNMTCSYMRATEIPKFVDKNEEGLLFPALIARIEECSIAQLLDVVDSHWARATNGRYGVLFKDMVRDRVITEAENMPVELIQRSIVVLGMSVGKRKRDLDLFQYLGRLLVRDINGIKDPHMLVEVLTAFARARIVPPNNFLGLMGRRFPVLNKRKPLGTVPSYRAFVNLYRMGHDQMNPFRFLADRVFAGVQENLTEERKRIRERMSDLEKKGIDPMSVMSVNTPGAPVGMKRKLAKKKKAAPAAAAADANEVTEASTEASSSPATEPAAEGSETPAAAPTTEDTPSADATGEAGAMPKTMPKRPTTTASSRPVKREALPPIPEELIYPTKGPAARRRFVAITGLKPIMFTKLLLILARFGAPHQTYLRPIVKPVLIPALKHFAPPSFSRLLRAMRLFASTDKLLIEAFIDRMVQLGPEKVVIQDLFEMLRIIAHPDTPPADNTEAFMDLCYSVFSDDSRLRAREMILVATDLLLLTRKDDVEIPALDKLMALIEVFAGRMTFLLNLGVLSLVHAEMLEEVCQQLKPPDNSGNIAGLREARRMVNQHDDEEYYDRLDIDVREIFFKTQVINSHNTYGAFRPIPAQMLWDYKQLLAKMRVDDVVEAVSLFAQAFPKRMILPLRRVLSASIIAKISKSGEPIIEDGEYKIVKTEQLIFTLEELKKFASQMEHLPLKRVQRNPTVWEHMMELAKQFDEDGQEIYAMAEAKLKMAQERAKLRALKKTLEKIAEDEADRVDDMSLPAPEELQGVVSATAAATAAVKAMTSAPAAAAATANTANEAEGEERDANDASEALKNE